jgi:monofunctional biosynthetic peptidoglycan transglycosylase
VTFSWRRTGRWAAGTGALLFALGAYLYLTLPDVRPLARTNPSTTAFMELRAREARAEDRRLRKLHRWVPYSRISPSLRRAVLAAEDDGFFRHDGIELAQMRESLETNLKELQPVRGGSTITQQLAKNLYLSPSRNPLRKVKELLIARRLEAELSKTRILEIYLNVIEWGDGIWGAEAASRAYFRTSAASLSREQAALLAAAIVNPRTLSPARPSRRLRRRQQIVLTRMGRVEPPPVERVTIVGTDDPPAASVVERETASASVDSTGTSPTDELREDSVQSSAASSP